MATLVTGDQYMGVDAKLLEIKRQLRQKDGYPFDLDQLKAALQAVIEGRFETSSPKIPFTEWEKHVPDGLKVKDGSGVSLHLTDVSEFEALEFIHESEWGRHVSRSSMYQRAKKLKAELGLADAVFLLMHQDQIPESMQWREINFIGTVLVNSAGRESAPQLRYNRTTTEWFLSFSPIDEGGCVGSEYVARRK